MKGYLVLFIAGLFVFGCFMGLSNAEKVQPVVQKVTPTPSLKGYTTHAPIRIMSDADFSSQFSNRTIWDLEINGTGFGFCIDIENCSLPFTVKDCYLHDASLTSWNTGLYLYLSSNGTLSNNYCKGIIGYGIYLASSNSNTLISNTCSANSQEGICLKSSTLNTINGNNCSGNSDDGILLGGISSYNELSGNTCNGNSNAGVELQAIAIGTNTLIDNNCCDNSQDGIYLGSNTDTIINNTCKGNYYGIKLVSANGDTVKNNNCSANPYGIYLASSHTNTFTSNVCDGNFMYGIYLYSSGTNTFVNNNLQGNTRYGVYIDTYSTMNCIHYNNFIYNNGGGKQANDTVGENFWNISGSPHGFGNYWSDWTGPDNNSDGIVDFPYHLDGNANATDHYPLSKLPKPFPWIALISPNGGEAWDIGSKHNITWLAGGGNGTLTINLEYSTNGSSGPWIPIASGIPNNGNFLWLVPNITSTNCFIRVTVMDSSSPAQTAYDMSVNPFTIQTPPPVPETTLSPFPLIIILIILITVTAVKRREL